MSPYLDKPHRTLRQFLASKIEVYERLAAKAPEVSDTEPTRQDFLAAADKARNMLAKSYLK